MSSRSQAGTAGLRITQQKPILGAGLQPRNSLKKNKINVYGKCSYCMILMLHCKRGRTNFTSQLQPESII